MKKKNKIACLVACALGAFIGAAQTYASYHQENTCFILLDNLTSNAGTLGSVEPNGPECEYIYSYPYYTSSGMHHSMCIADPTTGGKHCLPQDDHTEGNECVHGHGDSHYNSYTGPAPLYETISCWCIKSKK